MVSKPDGYRIPRVQANPDTIFQDYLPRQAEHVLRLTLERLQKNHRELSSSEIADLAEAAHYLHGIWSTVK